MKKEFSFDFLGRKIVVETGELAKQANGAVLVRYGDTVVLSASVMSNQVGTGDFFPLTVVYNEKLYSVGKIPGGFIKREGRPSESATLAARLIDRPIRPMFDENFRNEVQVINTILSVDPNNSPEITALFASSLALGISDIPFDGPVAGVIVGKIGKKYIINPTAEELDACELTVTVAGTKTDICMIEAGAKEASESDMVEALTFGQKHIKELCEFQESIIEVVGKEKAEITLATIDSDLEKEIKQYSSDDMLAAIQIKDKLTSYAKIEEVKEKTIEYFMEKYPDNEDIEKIARKVVNGVEGEVVRDLITEKHVRPDGRKLDEIRPLSAYIDLLPRTHGSAVFTRGQTQALATTTLGALGEHQILDGLGLEDSKRFMLHYNFPNFSVGETGRYGSPGRREIGHGALGERALLQVIPSEEDFPYTIRVVSEILESNGSSSQASICAGCLSLMAAGVPIKAPVAGIAMGLITKGKKYSILTDIQGIEDHMGDMDFKVAGTKNGITALQMDIKIKGVTKTILKEALAQAKKARLEILDLMKSVIDEPRKELSKYAPKIETFNINPDKIRDVIGRGGEMITKIILECSPEGVKTVNDKDAVKVDLEDDGRVIVYHTDAEVIARTAKRIKDITREVAIGEVYTGKVTKVEDFGCFVSLWEGCEGMVHVSQLANERVNKPSDVVKVGDEILVKATGYDNRGRLNLSRKDALPKDDGAKEKKKRIFSKKNE
ncbi:MAG: polyribonucleotide nucleotidyltransferase [Tenericutes bacterium]|nr:polyribonucleotide nucleotidyltransferase [Mycoplasmatota bacterium]